MPVSDPIAPYISTEIPFAYSSATTLGCDSERVWFENAKEAASKEEFDKEENISWAVFHAAK